MRAKGIFRPADHPAHDTPAVARALTALFDQLRPGDADPSIDRDHSGLAFLAHNPALAGRFAAMSRFLMLELGWSGRADLRELALQTVHLKLGCGFAYESRMAAAKAAGLSPDLLALLPLWRTSTLFDEEQRLVIEFAEATVAGTVSDALFARMTRRFGETGTVECTAVIAFWSAWAMILNVAQA